MGIRNEALAHQPKALGSPDRLGIVADQAEDGAATLSGRDERRQ
jgi:hypothetical protein